MGNIPQLRSDGFLPEGIHLASEAEFTFRFGSGTPQRRRLITRARRWIELARIVGALRLVIDGSFVTAKDNPDDVDALILLPNRFAHLVEQGEQSALELDQMLTTRTPPELFAAEDDEDWKEWCDFFTRTRESDGRRKGIVEIIL